ncbi:MAG TPA: hypothetical protein VEL11_19235 [Candidatus Bathyarchaeia archaeon]|nr:hypothetical protein [Candidatus Bathyarchaeia archaeon]
MNSKLSIVGIYGVLMIGIIFIMPQSNTDGKVFAQAAVAGNNQNATSKANTITTVTNAASSHTASNPYLNFNRAEGTIANIQDNESGKPTWILSGVWRLIIPEPFEVTSSHQPTSATFHAHFEMIKTNGKEMHSHSIYSFKLTHTSINNLATVFSGIATVTMKDGPHIGVPITISILNQRATSIWIDPTKTNNHFGNAPIYGTIGLII